MYTLGNTPTRIFSEQRARKLFRPKEQSSKWNKKNKAGRTHDFTANRKHIEALNARLSNK